MKESKSSPAERDESYESANQIWPHMREIDPSSPLIYIFF